MLDFRLKSLEQFQKMPLPRWGGNLDDLDFDDIQYYVNRLKNGEEPGKRVPKEIKETFDKLGFPEAEQKFLAGVSAQYESEVVYHSIQKDLKEQGVIFMDTDTALKEHPEIFREYFGTVVPPTTPIYSTNSLHSAVVEIIVKKDARVRYTTIQNWAPNIYNLVTKRAVAEENATMEWIDGNIGSKLTMKYPSVILKGRGAIGHVMSIAVAGKGQHQDAGVKMVQLAPETTSTIVLDNP